MGRHKHVECRIDETESSRSGVCDKVGKHKYVECKICLKTMRSDTLVRHMKMHKKKDKWYRCCFGINRI